MHFAPLCLCNGRTYRLSLSHVFVLLLHFFPIYSIMRYGLSGARPIQLRSKSNQQSLEGTASRSPRGGATARERGPEGDVRSGRIKGHWFRRIERRSDRSAALRWRRAPLQRPRPMRRWDKPSWRSRATTSRTRRRLDRQPTIVRRSCRPPIQDDRSALKRFTIASKL